MATSGQTAFDLDVNEIMEEAFERAGVDKQKLNADHTRSARRSMNMILQKWGNVGVRPWAIEQDSYIVTQGCADELLPQDTIDIIDLTLKRVDYEIPMTRLSRSDYQALPDKTIQGRPDRYWVHKDRVEVTNFIYQTPENSTDEVIYWKIRRLHDITKPTETVDVPARWLEPFTAELAYRLYQKRPVELRNAQVLADLKTDARDCFLLAREEDRDRADVRVVPDMTTYSS